MQGRDNYAVPPYLEDFILYLILRVSSGKF